MKKVWWAALLLCGLLTQAPAQPMDANFEEQAAIAAMDEGKYVRLRELAEKMLKEEGTKERASTYFFKGVALRHGEGDLPRAKWYFRQAAKRFREQYGDPPSRSAPWGWLYKILIELGYTTGEMDEYEDQIKVWDELGKLLSYEYGQVPPGLKAFYSWPLMKLGREAEAREYLQQASMGQDEDSVVQRLNSLGALEMETGHTRACYQAFQELLQVVRNNGWMMTCTYLRNAGEAAACLLKFDEAEKLYLESTEYFDPTSYSTPWFDLATLYLSQARFPEAVSALKKCRMWSKRQEAHLEPLSFAANQQVTTEILLQLGMVDRAYEVAKSFVERPDRKGGDSVQRDQWQAANWIVFREAARAQRESIRETMTWSRGSQWWKLLWLQRDLAWQAYLRGQQAAASIVAHGRIHSAMRYQYATGTILIPNYMRLELPTLLGPGTTLAALDELEAKGFESLELEFPYLQAMRFEAFARAGRSGEALALLDGVLDKLPASEVLLKVRVQARAAQLYQRSGDTDKSVKLLQQVMEKAPGTLRSLQMALPIEITTDGSAVAENAASMCRRSPRFSEAQGAFRAKITSAGATLMGPDGSVLAEARPAPLEKGEQPDSKLAECIHDRFFAAPIDLSQMDTESLDGINTKAVQSKEMEEYLFPGSTQDPNQLP
jgi:tetratricopeptide (TPR) repeat protein